MNVVTLSVKILGTCAVAVWLLVEYANKDQWSARGLALYNIMAILGAIAIWIR